MTTTRMQIHRPLDLESIDAVGFDLDHTLALYDDAEVNRIAAAGACRLLVEELRYPDALLDPVALETPAAGRTLAADLVHGAVVKLGTDRRAVHGRLHGRWLTGDDIHGRFPGVVADDPATAYSIYSPFSLPVLWLMDTMERLAPVREGRAQRCDDIRHMLDMAHTNGSLKQQLRDDLPRFVRGIAGVRDGLERWKAAGKRLFVVTNSEADFAPGVLDIAVGPGWDTLFDAVVMHARKPGFFQDGAGGLEKLLGVSPGRIVYVGDNTRSDIRAARMHGWRTVQVVPEMDAPGDDDAWGHPLAHRGEPTWLAERIRAADAACPHAGDLLALDPRATRLAPAAGHPDSA